MSAATAASIDANNADPLARRKASLLPTDLDKQNQSVAKYPDDEVPQSEPTSAVPNILQLGLLSPFLQWLQNLRQESLAVLGASRNSEVCRP